MKKEIYSPKELKVLVSNEPLADFSLAEYFYLLDKAFRNDDFDFVNEHLCDTYPEFTDLYADYSSPKYTGPIGDPADREISFKYPILIDGNRMTERRVLDIVSYLFDCTTVPPKYLSLLQKDVTYNIVFNYHLAEYVRDYDKDSLWKDFFMCEPTLTKVISARKIWTS